MNFGKSVMFLKQLLTFANVRVLQIMAGKKTVNDFKK